MQATARDPPDSCRLRHRRHAAGRRADGDHAVDGHVRLARSSRSTPPATCTATAATGGSSPTSALFVFSMTMLVSVSNFVLLYVFWEAVGVCSYLLIGFWYRKARSGRGRQEGVPRQPRRRLRLRAGAVPDLDDLRHAQLSRHDGRRRRVGRGDHGRAGPGSAGRPGTVTSAAASPWRSACCCCSAPAARAPSSRCTSGCPTRWKAPRPSAR